MYAQTVTDAMEAAIEETNRRRAKQVAYNKEHGIEPVGIVKAVRDLTDQISQSAKQAIAESKAGYRVDGAATMPKSELEHMIEELEKRMKAAAQALEFEQAALLRDQIMELRTILAEDDSLKPWERIKILAGEE
jgi:excinuclease ABC subunit B